MASEAGVIHGVVENISRSIALTDEVTSTAMGSFTDAQTRMIGALEDIQRIATDMPLTAPESLGPLALKLSERYSELASDSRLAIATLSSPNLAQKLRVAVQKLGTSCIELVKIAGQRRSYPEDLVEFFVFSLFLMLLLVISSLLLSSLSLSVSLLLIYSSLNQ